MNEETQTQYVEIQNAVQSLVGQLCIQIEVLKLENKKLLEQIDNLNKKQNGSH